MGQHGAVRRPAAVNYWEGTANSTWQFLVGNLLILTSLAVGVLFLVNPSFLNLSTTDSIGGGITLILASQVTVILSDDKNLRTNKNLKASQMQKPKALRKQKT